MMMLQKSKTDALKTSSKRVVQKAVEATDDLTGNKIAKAIAESYDSKITKILKNSQQNNSESVTNEHDKEIPKEKYLSSEERQETIDELRLK